MSQIAKHKKMLYETAERRGHVLPRAKWKRYRSKKNDGIIVEEFCTYCVLCEKTAGGSSHPEDGKFIYGELLHKNCTVGSAPLINPKSFHIFYNTDEKSQYEERIRKVVESLNRKFNVPE